MSVRRHKKLAILHKVEATYGTDIVPTAADALIASNVAFTPMEGEEVTRDLMLPYMGNQGVILAGLYASLEFDIEVAGAGAAGTVPRFGGLLRSCGFAETVTPGTSVSYSIVENDVESGSIYFIQDDVQHVILGARGTVSWDFTPKGIPKMRFSIMGLLGTITDIASMPVVSASALIAPLVVSKANTTQTLHGWPCVAESLSLDIGNEVTPRFLIGDELVAITDRNSSGSTVVEARKLAVVDWFEIALNRTRGPLSLVHGKTVGNIFELDAPLVEIGKPTQGQTNNVVNYTLPLGLVPNVGLDELVITVR